MTRTAQNLEINNFSAGLNTEASPLDYPPNSSIDEQNLVLNKDGSRSRRNGLKREAVSELLTPIIGSQGTESINLFLNNIKVSPTEGFILSSAKQSSRLLSRDPSTKNWTGVTLTTGYGLIGGIEDPTGSVHNSIALTANTVITGNLGDRLLGYNLETEEFLSSTGTAFVKVRDLWGSLKPIDEENFNRRWLEKPATTLTSRTANHVYNLYNGTWPARWNERDTFNDSSNGDETIIFTPETGSAGDKLPALTDNFWLYVSDVADDLVATGSYVINSFEEWSYYKDLSEIRGRFIISPFRRSETRLEEVEKYSEDLIGNLAGEPEEQIPNLLPEYEDTSQGQFNCVTGHLGRVWTASRTEDISTISSTPDLDSLVFFSQTAKSPKDATKMYGDISPTAEDYEGDLATDGGFVTISGMSKCTALVPLDRALMVFSPEGVWQIDGGEDNFSATNVQVTRLSEIGTSFSRSIVSTGQAIYYWGQGGIYRIVQNDVSLKGVANNISYSKVNRLVEEVEFPERLSGIFDVVSQECRWVFCEKGKTTVDRQCSSELVFDTVTEAFSINRFPTGSQYPQMLGYVPIERYRTTDSDRGTSVALVGVAGDGNRTGDSGMQYEFYTYTNEDYLDYDHIAGGVDANAYMLGGFITASDSQRKKQVGYVTCSFKRTEDGFIGSEETGWEASNPSSCFMQSQWGWTSSATTGKWGRKQQVYRLPRLYVPNDPATDDWSDFGYEVINSRSKVRGMGKALSILFESEPGKNFRLYGWGSNASIADAV